jgi:hypothetical protein
VPKVNQGILQETFESVFEFWQIDLDGCTGGMIEPGIPAGRIQLALIRYITASAGMSVLFRTGESGVRWRTTHLNVLLSHTDFLNPTPGVGIAKIIG